MGMGKMQVGDPPIEIGFVDVRDVAEAHISAGYIPDAMGRYIVAKETLSLLDLAKM